MRDKDHVGTEDTRIPNIESETGIEAAARNERQNRND
jgi:hypothetical protein